MVETSQIGAEIVGIAEREKKASGQDNPGTPMCAVLVVVVALMALMDLAQAVPHPDPAANPDPQFEALHRTLSRGLARSLVHIRNLLH